MSEQKNRKKILLLSDDLRFPSGVGTMSKEIVFNTADRFDWVQIGAAIRHPDIGKVIDMSEEVKNTMHFKDDVSVKIYPSNGYGNMMELRRIMKAEKPDAIFIFTDPRYWVWLFNNEREIRLQCPIVYLNIWDNLPYPMWNKQYYESCDGLFAISKQTYNINKVVLGELAKSRVLKYIPHGVSDKFFPIENPTETEKEFMDVIRGGHEFVLLYNARNLGRKRAADLLLAWRHFCDTIGKEKAKQCRLVLHTDPVDNAGTDLYACYEAYCDPEYVHVVFDKNKYPTERMNLLYNASDGVILISSAEGWGLSLTEALMTGKMFIAPISGGMQDQMRFEDKDGNWINFSQKFPSNHTNVYKTHGEWCIPVQVNKGRSLVGSPQTPYIFDDRASIEDITNAILTLYTYGPDNRKYRGEIGHKWACSEEAGFTAKQMGDKIVEGLNEVFEKVKIYPRSRYEFCRVENESTYIDYDPVEYSVEQ